MLFVLEFLDLFLPPDIIEACLFVLWRHLEYYLLYCTPTDPKDSLLPGYRGKKTGLDQTLI